MASEVLFVSGAGGLALCKIYFDLFNDLGRKRKLHHRKIAEECIYNTDIIYR